MGKTHKRPSVKQHRDLYDDEQYRPKVVETKKRKVLNRKLTKREIEAELNEGYDYTRGYSDEMAG